MKWNSNSRSLLSFIELEVRDSELKIQISERNSSSFGWVKKTLSHFVSVNIIMQLKSASNEQHTTLRNVFQDIYWWHCPIYISPMKCMNMSILNKLFVLNEHESCFNTKFLYVVSLFIVSFSTVRLEFGWTNSVMTSFSSSNECSL